MKIQISTHINILASVILILSRPAYSQDWQWQNPYPSGNKVYSMELIDSLNIWFGSSAGTLWNSTDGGVEWKIVELLEPDLYINTISFISTEKGWIGGNNDYGPNIVLHTTDGGMSWESQLNDTVNQRITAINFFDHNYGWVGTEGEAQIYFTKNGGNSWQVSDWQPPIHSSKVTTIVFLDSLRGYAEGINIPFIYTHDGGTTWEDVEIEGKVGRAVCFSDSLHGWLSSNGTILRTTDSGTTWHADLPEFTEYALYDIFFHDNSYGWVTTKENGIFRTTDGGSTWTLISSISPRIQWKGINFFSSQSGWIDFNRTWDGGITLHPQKTGIIGEDFDALDFYNKNTGWIVSNGGIIAHTTNGGSDWVIQDNQMETNFEDIYAYDSLHVWAVGWAGRIYRTDNGGNTWEIREFSKGIDTRHTGIFFPEIAIGFITGGNSYLGGWILKTYDTGQSWEEITPFTMPKLLGVHFFDRDTGLVIAGGGTSNDRGAIYRTTNGGDSWELIFEHSKGLETISFINNKIGWASGYEIIVKTTDSGENWEVINESLPSSNIFFSDSLNGWICDIIGSLYVTTDGGFTWQKESTRTTETLNDLFFIDPEHGWLVGNNATILNRSNINSGVQIPPSQKIQNSGIQVLNYPNPFNSYTYIDLDIPSTCHLSVRIYNISGKEVRTINKNSIESGRHQLIWDGTNTEGGSLESGVYICSIFVDGHLTTSIKMIMIK